MTTHSLPVLNQRFRRQSHYEPATVGYRLLPFRFTTLDGDRYAATNMAGEYLILGRAQLKALVDGGLAQTDPLYHEALARHFILDAASDVALDLLATKYRSRHAHLAAFTGLHLFVVTLRCDHSCPYCQVSRVSSDRAAFDMTPETADRAIELMFRSPNPRLKVEFQGGESLLNFDLVRHIVAAVKTRNASEDRIIDFVIATNLAPLTDDMLEFCREHGVFISTSLDGPRELHNANRPRPGGDSYERAIDGIRRCREALGPHAVSALMTTTRRSLGQPEAIIDEYRAQGFGSVFLRWLSPYGFAVRSQRALGYPVEEWTDFYARGLRHIISMNRGGERFREEYAGIVLRKMLTPFPSGYVDLQSPSGLGISAVVYNYDGDVYASDESRMLAESGDTSFRLGNVHDDSYEQIFLSDRLLDILASTMTEGTPMCTDCAFEPWCGTDPTFHHATQGDMVGHRPSSAFCGRNMFVFRHLLGLLESDPQTRSILRNWV
jgi:uncharacterized protein